MIGQIGDKAFTFYGTPAPNYKCTDCSDPHRRTLYDGFFNNIWFNIHCYKGAYSCRDCARRDSEIDHKKYVLQDIHLKSPEHAENAMRQKVEKQMTEKREIEEAERQQRTERQLQKARLESATQVRKEAETTATMAIQARGFKNSISPELNAGSYTMERIADNTLKVGYQVNNVDIDPKKALRTFKNQLRPLIAADFIDDIKMVNGEFLIILKDSSYLPKVEDFFRQATA